MNRRILPEITKKLMRLLIYIIVKIMVLKFWSLSLIFFSFVVFVYWKMKYQIINICKKIG
jgi:hypothetical protein